MGKIQPQQFNAIYAKQKIQHLITVVKTTHLVKDEVKFTVCSFFCVGSADGRHWKFKEDMIQKGVLLILDQLSQLVLVAGKRSLNIILHPLSKLNLREEQLNYLQ